MAYLDQTDSHIHILSDRLNYRPLVRDGFTWRPQGQLNQLTARLRPAQGTQPQYVLQRLFYYDFAGTGGYARLKSSKDLQFCKDHVQFQLTPLHESKQDRMMAFTFFDYKKVSRTSFHATIYISLGQNVKSSEIK